MTEVLHSPSHFPSSPRTSNTLFHSQTQLHDPNSNHGSSPSSPVVLVVDGGGVSTAEEESGIGKIKHRREKDREELSLFTLAVAVLRKSLVACKVATREELSAMDIGWPTNVRHVAHVTYDRFNGFSGLPEEFEPEITRAPSASTSVFGVSTESMQLLYDTRGNCVPSILVLMQRRLYTQGGLQAEGIFRINAENSREEFVRDQLNRGIVPDDIDVHCLAGLIKAWFRELPSGVMDPLSPEQVMQSESDEECSELVRLLPSTEACLLDWVINLMADVVQEEPFNKMNAHNIAMVFAPNMTQMMDPVTAITYTVQVMNILKALITMKLRERQDSRIQPGGMITCAGPSDGSGHQSPSQAQTTTSLEDHLSDGCHRDNNSEEHFYYDCEDESDNFPLKSEESREKVVVYSSEGSGSSNGSWNGNFCDNKKGFVNDRGELLRTVTTPTEKAKVNKGVCSLNRMSSRIERIETWR